MKTPIESPTGQTATSLADSYRAPEVSVVLPVRNERGSLERLDRELREAILAMGRPSEILYVDDHSTDGSAQVLHDLTLTGAPIRTRAVRLRRHYGQTAALAAGIDLAEGDAIVGLDADGQNNPSDIPRLIAKLDEGYDVVSGWRRARTDGLISRKIPSAIANWLIRKMTGLKLHDTGCTLKAYRTSCLREINLYGDMHRFLPVFLERLGARVTELAVDHRPRFGGNSKYGSGRALRVLVDLIHIRFVGNFYTRPMHFFGGLASIFFALTVVVVFAMFAFKFGWLLSLGLEYRASFVETPLPSLVATFFVGAVLSLFFGLLAEILIRIHHESGRLRTYMIRSIEDSREETQ